MEQNQNPNLSRTADGDRSGTLYYERFHLNQFYNAVEDEQLYTDEYTNLLQSYNQFIVTGNTMFSRMEQALRANLERSIVRQSFYYHRYSDIRRIRRPDDAMYHFTPAPVPAAAPSAPVAAAPAPATAPATAPAPVAPSSDPNQSRRSRVGDTFGRMLANYFNTEHNRNERQNAYAVADATADAIPNMRPNMIPTPNPNPHPNPNTNLYSMLYTYTQPIVFDRPPAAAGPSVPTSEQIRRATLNTTYSNITTPVNNTCPISRDEFDDESEITMIRGCNHIFNRGSLREWFVNHSTCPMCRNDIRDYRVGSNTQSRGGGGGGGGGGNEISTNDIYSRIMDNSQNFINMAINSVSNDSLTFSYDLPPLYNNLSNFNEDQLYRDILNTVAGVGAAIPPTTVNDNIRNHNGYGDNEDGGGGDYDDNDYMEVD